MVTVGIETRATIPSNTLLQLEEELFFLGFAGSLTFSGVGVLPNGIIVRSEKQRREPQITTIEFSYPPFDDTKDDKILENVCNQYSSFFHMIKKYGGNPYPWYINLEEWEEMFTGYKNLKAVSGIAECSINPIHINLSNLSAREDMYPYFLFPLSVGEVSWIGVLRGPLLSVVYEKSPEGLLNFMKNEPEDYRKSVDLREFAREYTFPKNIEIRFGIRVNSRDSRVFIRREILHYALTGLPQDILSQIKNIECVSDLGKGIRSFFSYSFRKDNLNNSYENFISLESSTLMKIAKEIKNLPSFKSLPRVPIYEVISNSSKFKSIATKYLEEKWGVAKDPLADAYALLLSEVDYVERIVQPTDEKLYEVTNFPLVKVKEEWFSELAKKHKITVYHVLRKGPIINYQIGIESVQTNSR